MLVLSVEGPTFINRSCWCTHKILGAFFTEEMAVAAIPADLDLTESIVLLTNLTTGAVRRIEKR